MQFDRRVRVAFLGLVALIVLSAVGFRSAVGTLNLYLRKEAVELREPLDTIPATLGHWKRWGPDGRFGAAMVESLGTNQYLDRKYAYDGDPKKGLLSLHIAYYTGMVDAVPHVPERCWGAAGMAMVAHPSTVRIPFDRADWTTSDAAVDPQSGERYPQAKVADPVTRRANDVSMPLGESDASVTVFQDGQSPQHMIVGGYFFIANGRLAATPYVVRTYAFDLNNRYAYYCKVQFSLSVPTRGNEVEIWTQRVGDLLTPLFPHLMWCLPDWPSLEAPDPKES